MIVIFLNPGKDLLLGQEGHVVHRFTPWSTEYTSTQVILPDFLRFCTLAVNGPAEAGGLH
ncbi:MAG: hypothetical protein Kow0063_05420 [Anaerolineae bacterium]